MRVSTLLGIMKVIKFTKVNKVNKLNLEQFAHTPYSLQPLHYEDQCPEFYIIAIHTSYMK